MNVQINPSMYPLRKAALPLVATAMFLSATSCAKETNCHTVTINQNPQPTITPNDSIPAGVDTVEYLNMMESLRNIPRMDVENNSYTIVCD